MIYLVSSRMCPIWERGSGEALIWCYTKLYHQNNQAPSPEDASASKFRPRHRRRLGPVVMHRAPLLLGMDALRVPSVAMGRIDAFQARNTWHEMWRSARAPRYTSQDFSLTLLSPDRLMPRIVSCFISLAPWLFAASAFAADTDK